MYVLHIVLISVMLIMTFEAAAAEEGRIEEYDSTDEIQVLRFNAAQRDEHRAWTMKLEDKVPSRRGERQTSPAAGDKRKAPSSDISPPRKRAVRYLFH